ncbi:electron transport complex subunit RsxC [Buchnera aphidicola (Melanaphis sacchari)]|uniref:Ion-translocating oxidoreductase complex subunit C n=1 Tax=Buchnera aphidicola (Melanaphis sacchari) TaxID=2173854 RepID=A0A2U8DFQ6_9GAMM|nr:electron transport complex subunit RsxC [Buchnera aphidicola]AWH90650.1 electron transport complex subunit RsxC [Buchnera aphidicola (Melanaphis sacchari)]
MLKLFFFIKFLKKLFVNFFKKKKIYNFKGGVQCFPIKEKYSEYFLNYVPLPKEFYIFLNSSNFKEIKLNVKINQRVLCGQPLTSGDDYIVPIHSPTSGWIKKISHSSKKQIKIVIISDYLDQWIRLKKITNYKKYTSENLIKKIHKLGIVGLGGGQFPSSRKLKLSINKAHTLIINAVESDPYITADFSLIKNYLNEIILGCEIISWISKTKNILIAIQQDKVNLIKDIKRKIKNKPFFKIFIMKKKYPGGSSKILIKSLIGKEVPHLKHSINIGYLVFNVSTVYAIKRAIINGEPLIQRVVSFLNNNKNNTFSKNFWVKIGTPVRFFLNHLNITNNIHQEICSGGIFMSNIITDLNDSIFKGTNCIYIKNKKNNENIIQYPCINCGYCTNLCPVNLIPQKMYLYSKNNNHQMTQKLNIMDCIQCRICDKVCPSNIPLVKYFKKEKRIQKDINLENNRKKFFLSCFKNREKRLFNQKKNSFIDGSLHKSKQSFSKNIENVKKEQKEIRRKMLHEAIERAKLKK